MAVVIEVLQDLGEILAAIVGRMDGLMRIHSRGERVIAFLIKRDDGDGHVLHEQNVVRPAGAGSFSERQKTGREFPVGISDTVGGHGNRRI